MKTGIELIAEERQRQIEKGWSLGHDQRHGNGELLKAAETYITPEHYDNGCPTRREKLWPFNTKFKGGESRIDELVKAGALIAAEIDRLTVKREINIMPKSMHIRTRVYTLQEGWDLCCAIMRKGYEGVQNDSSRYNDIMLASYFMERGYCWVGVWGDCLHISSTHDKEGRKKLKELGKCKFIEELGLSVRKCALPKSLEFYARKEK